HQIEGFAAQGEIEEVTVEEIAVAEALALLEAARELERGTGHVHADDGPTSDGKKGAELPGTAPDLEHTCPDRDLSIQHRRIHAACRARQEIANGFVSVVVGERVLFVELAHSHRDGIEAASGSGARGAGTRGGRDVLEQAGPHDLPLVPAASTDDS